jgi:hypothetical protein
MADFTPESVQEANDRGINVDNFETQEELDQGIAKLREEQGEESPGAAQRRREEEEQAALEPAEEESVQTEGAPE